jgi:imidazolonepropionase-like amidohydrolase
MPLPEMELLLAAGLTPMDVIRAGTQHAAWVCGHGDELGTLAAGMLADVIVVDGDPLTDMQAMGRVVAIVKGGQNNPIMVFPLHCKAGKGVRNSRRIADAARGC